MIELHATDHLIAIVDQLKLLESLDHSRSFEVVTEIRIVETVILEVERDVLGPRGLEDVVLMSGVVRLTQVGGDQLLCGSVDLGE